MTDLVYRINQIHATLLSSVPKGTNLALSHLMWAMTTGNFLPARGSVASALYQFGCPEDAIDRAEQALNTGKWSLDTLVASWREQALRDPDWKVHRFEGYCPVACDLTAFFRPKLKGLKTKHYKSEAGKALPAVVYALVGEIGQVQGQRHCLPRQLIRHDQEEESEIAFQNKVVCSALSGLKLDEVLVIDRGFSLEELLAAGKGHFVVRLRQNFTARRNYLPAYKGVGRYPEYGEVVRPQSRQYGDKTIEATPSDETHHFTGRDPKTGKDYTLRIEVWNEVVLPDSPPGGKTFRCIACHDSRFEDPLLLATDLTQVACSTVRQIYGDRWGVEQPPLAAKQMLGLERHFVHGRQSRYRLPGLALLMGNVLSFIAAKEPAIPTGRWDKKPKSTCGRLRRFLSRLHFFDLPVESKLREKASDTSRLPSGVEAKRIHRAKTLQTGLASPVLAAF